MKRYGDTEKGRRGDAANRVSSSKFAIPVSPRLPVSASLLPAAFILS
jgi:hypothetical protein